MTQQNHSLADTDSEENIDGFDMSLDYGNFGDDFPELDLTRQPNTLIRDNFQEFCKQQLIHTQPLSSKMRAAVELLCILRAQSGSLANYDAIMKWHLRQNSSNIAPTINNNNAHLSLKKVHKTLRERYNYPKSGHMQTELITLPHSKARAKLVFNLAQDMMTSLLSDPRINDEDYLFFDDDPFSKPPENPPVSCLICVNKNNDITI